MGLWPDLMAGAYALEFVEVGGVRTRALEAGDGDEAVLMLHGVGGHLETFTRNIHPHAEKYKVFAIDMVGHGFSDGLGRNQMIQDYVDHAFAFMDLKGFKKFHICGESLGGWVGARMAAQQPDRVGKLVLNTAAGLTADEKVMEKIYTLTMNAVRNPDRDTVRTRLEFLMKDPETVTDDLTETRYNIYIRPGMVENMEHIMCLQSMDLRVPELLTNEELQTIKSPTLVIWTTDDPTAGVPIGEQFRDNIPGAELVVMAECGHWPQYEDADEYNRLQLEFLAK